MDERLKMVDTSMKRHRHRPDALIEVLYVYADPTLCRCLYVGGEAEHSEYRRLAVQHENARREAARRARGSSPSGGAVGGAP